MVDSEPVAGVQFMLYSVTVDIDLKVCVVLSCTACVVILCVCEERRGEGW